MARAEQRLERHQQALRDDKNLRRSKPFRERRAREEQKREKRREREIERKVATATEVIQLLRKLPAEDFDRLSELMSDVGMLWHVHDLLESAKLELPHGEPEAKPAEPPLVKCLKTVRRNVESAMRELPPEEWVDLLRRLRGEIDDIDEKEIGDHGHHAERQSD
jgi:hypothetical protein